VALRLGLGWRRESLTVKSTATPVVQAVEAVGWTEVGGMGDGSAVETGRGAEDVTEADPMVAVYRHDVHKLRHRGHNAAAASYAGVAVNETVPLYADRDAALLSRPEGDPEQTVANHSSPYRLSLLTGESAVETDRIRAAAGGGVRDLVRPDDPDRLHARWLTSEVAGAYSESVHYPYTSLQYHTLLAAALLDNYRAGYAFDDLWVVATAPDLDATAGKDVTRDSEVALTVASVEPHRTVLWTPALALHVTGAPGDRPAARLGNDPARSFADVWARLPAHPISVDDERRWRVLDAQLRRIRSWSTALAFIDEFVAVHGPPERGDGA